MLSQSELTTLQKLINDETMTFEDLKKSCQPFLDNSFIFKVGLTLSMLIRDHQLSFSQEISSFYILYCLSEKEKDKGYYSITSLVIDILKETKSKTKKIFLIELLQNKIKNQKMKIKEYKEYVEQLENNKKLEEEINLEILKLNKDKVKFLQKDLYMNPILYEKKIIDIKKNDTKNNIQLTSEEPFFHYFKSNYMSYYDSSVIIFKNEPYWIFPMLNHNYIWENNTYDKISFLLNQILSNTPLTKEDNKFIITTVNKNPNIIKNINFTPEQMMCLIEKDESLSFEILVVVCKVSLNE